nr:MAG TPA: YopX protein [Caudoviricetes sp.]
MLALKFRVWLPDIDQMLRVKALVFEKDKTRCVCGYSFDFYLEDENATIMQSTGLVDKNGKEVFVGDIIKCTRGCLHEVYIEKEYGGTYFGGMPAVYLKDLREGYAWTEHEEIIGNIYENPELLEEK